MKTIHFLVVFLLSLIFPATEIFAEEIESPATQSLEELEERSSHLNNLISRNELFLELVNYQNSPSPGVREQISALTNGESNPGVYTYLKSGGERSAGDLLNNDSFLIQYTAEPELAYSLDTHRSNLYEYLQETDGVQGRVRIDEEKRLSLANTLGEISGLNQNPDSADELASMTNSYFDQLSWSILMHPDPAKFIDEFSKILSGSQGDRLAAEKQGDLIALLSETSGVVQADWNRIFSQADWSMKPLRDLLLNFRAWNQSGWKKPLTTVGRNQLELINDVERLLTLLNIYLTDKGMQEKFFKSQEEIQNAKLELPTIEGNIELRRLLATPGVTAKLEDFGESSLEMKLWIAKSMAEAAAAAAENTSDITGEGTTQNTQAQESSAAEVESTTSSSSGEGVPAH